MQLQEDMKRIEAERLLKYNSEEAIKRSRLAIQRRIACKKQLKINEEKKLEENSSETII